MSSVPVTDRGSEEGVPLSLEPERTLSSSLYGMDQDSPSVRDTLCKFPNRRVGEPDLVIVSERRSSVRILVPHAID